MTSKSSKVAIQIHSKQTYEMDVEEIRQSYKGTVLLKGKTVFIQYDEYEADAKTETLIVIEAKEPNKEQIYIRKTGAVEAQLLFSANDRSKAHYQTPMGGMLFDIIVKQLHVKLGKKIYIKIDYHLFNNKEKISDNFFQLEAKVIDA